MKRILPIILIALLIPLAFAQEEQPGTPTFWESYGLNILILTAILLLIIEIILFIKSKKIQSASLKTSILLPSILIILY